jgi:hypothetical protein
MGNPFWMLQKQSVVSREEVHSGGGMSNPPQYLLSSTRLAPHKFKKAEEQEAQTDAFQVLWQWIKLHWVWEQRTFETQSSCLFGLSKQ